MTSKRGGRPPSGTLPEAARLVATALRYFGLSHYSTIRQVVGYIRAVEGLKRTARNADRETERGLRRLRQDRLVIKRSDGLYELSQPLGVEIDGLIHDLQEFRKVVLRTKPTLSPLTEEWDSFIKNHWSKASRRIELLMKGEDPGAPPIPFLEPPSPTVRGTEDVDAARRRQHKLTAYFVLSAIGDWHRGLRVPREKRRFVRRLRRVRRGLEISGIEAEEFAVPSLENPEA